MLRFLPLIGALALAIATGATPVSAAEVTLRVHHFLGEDSLPQKAIIEPWARRVERDSGGRIKVRIFPDMELGGHAPDLVKQVKEGTVDIIWTAAAYTPLSFPRSLVFCLPLVHKGDPVVTNLALRDIQDTQLFGDYTGLKPLLLHVHSGHALHMARHSITRLDQLAGLTLRPPGRTSGRWTVEALGANTTRKRHPKLGKALEAGKLDGVLMSFGLANSMGVIEAATSHTMLAKDEFFGTSLYLFLMNQARYEALPADLREAIDRNSGRDLSIRAGRAYEKAARAAMETARKAGHAVNVLQPADQLKARTLLLEVLSRYAKTVEPLGVNGLQMINRARKAMARAAQSMTK